MFAKPFIYFIIDGITQSVTNMFGLTTYTHKRGVTERVLNVLKKPFVMLIDISKTP